MMRVSDVKYILSLYRKHVPSIYEYLQKFCTKEDAEISLEEFKTRILPLKCGQHSGLRNIFRIYVYLARFKIPIQQDNNLKNLFNLKPNHLSRVNCFVHNLYLAGQFNQDSFNKIIEIVKAKQPYVEPHYLASSEPFGSMERVRFDANLNYFFFSTQVVGEGTFGKIRMGYDNSTAKSNPDHAVKELKDGVISDPSIYARREVTINRLLGRSAFYYVTNKKFTVVSEWQTGKKFFDFTSADFLKISLFSRFKSALVILSELNTLHAYYRVHGDISGSNVMFDPDKQKLNLVDFGSAHKIGSRKRFSHTPGYYDKFQTLQGLQETHSFDFCDDMYSLSYLFAELFPELFKLMPITLSDAEVTGKKSGHRSFYIIKDTEIGSPTIQALAIRMLVHAMSHNEISNDELIVLERQTQCTAANAVQFCAEVLETWHSLNKDLLNEIAEASIHKQKISYDDAIHGHTHSRRM